MLVWLLALTLVIPLGLDLYMPVPEDNRSRTRKSSSGGGCSTTAASRVIGTIACASCHDPERAFSDVGRSPSASFGRIGRRNAPALINRGYGRAFFWDGRIATLEEQVLQADSGSERNGSDARRSQSSRVGSASADDLAGARQLRPVDSVRQLAVRSLRQRRSTALTAEQQRGLQIFRGKGNCTACHVGPNFTDERFHNTGVAWRDGRLQDEGRGA